MGPRQRWSIAYGASCPYKLIIVSLSPFGAMRFQVAVEQAPVAMSQNFLCARMKAGHRLSARAVLENKDLRELSLFPK